MPAFTMVKYKSGAPTTNKSTVAATNMGPKGFTPAQKAQINARLKKKAAKQIG